MNSFHALYRFNSKLLKVSSCKYSNKHNKIIELLPTREQLKLEMQVKSNLAQAKFFDILKWYEQFTGLSEVRVAQQKVLDSQEQFTNVQNKRREVYEMLSDIQTKRNEISEKLQLSKPGQPNYLKLIMEDHEIIGEENKLKQAFYDIEKLERELFTNLTTAVRISHERERLQADKTKYWSIIGSILGTIIGLIGSSINNSYKLTELKVILNEISTVSKTTANISNEKFSMIEKLIKQAHDTTYNMIGKPIMRTFGTQTLDNEIKEGSKGLESNDHYLIPTFAKQAWNFTTNLNPKGLMPKFNYEKADRHLDNDLQTESLIPKFNYKKAEQHSDNALQTNCSIPKMNYKKADLYLDNDLQTEGLIKILYLGLCSALSILCFCCK